jgi:hypothetical protein
MMVRLGCLIPVLVAGCAGANRPIPEAVRPHMFRTKLSTVFRDCGPGEVHRISLTDYEVAGCDMVATYHCPTASRADDPVCRLEAFERAPPPQPDPAPPQPDPVPPAPAQAPKPPPSSTADRLFEEGRMLAKLYRFREACLRFTESDAIARTFGTAVNLGDCALREGRLGDAWQLYEDAERVARRDAMPSLAGFARDRAEVIEPRLYTIVVQMDDPGAPGLKLKIGHRVVAPARSVRVLVDPGDVRIVVYRHSVPMFRRTVSGRAGQRKLVNVPRFP